MGGRDGGEGKPAGRRVRGVGDSTARWLKSLNGGQTIGLLLEWAIGPLASKGESGGTPDQDGGRRSITLRSCGSTPMRPSSFLPMEQQCLDF